jgi:RNA polymerase sigma-70 factor, ECF subfamily
MTDTPNSIPTWSPVVEQIKAGRESAIEDLYKVLRPGIRTFFLRQIGPDHADDACHDVIVDLIAAIKAGALREPESLGRYAMTIARRKAIAYIGGTIRGRQTMDAERRGLLCDASESPEQVVLRLERQAIAKRVLTALPARQRELLIRFYLNGESREDILAVTGMSDTQFRLIKSRAKARYTDLMRETLNRPNPKPVASYSGVFTAGNRVGDT